MSYQHASVFAIFGNGGAPIAAHSIYFQVLGNHGFVGLFIFLCLWLLTYRYAGWLNKNAVSIPQARWAADLGGMIQVALIGYAVGGAFLSLAYFDLPYYMMVMVVIARKWVETKAWERDTQTPFLVYAGLKNSKARPANSLSTQNIASRY